MTLEQIITLKTIQTAGSFRAASLKMNKAQSAISYAIRSLEDELGFSLFTRDQYRPQLTLQGLAFLKKADSLIGELEDLKETAQFLQRGHEPQIRLAVSALFPLPLLTECLKSFQNKYPRTEIKVLHDVLSAEEQLLEGQADLAFGELLNETQLLKCHDVVSIRLIPVATTAFIKALPKTASARFEELSKRPQIILEGTSRDKSKSAGVFSKNNLFVQNLESKRQFLMAGLGWGFMPESIVKEDVKARRLGVTHDEEIQLRMRVAHLKKIKPGPCAGHILKFFS